MQSRPGGQRPANQGPSQPVRWAILAITILVTLLLGFMTERLGQRLETDQLEPAPWPSATSISRPSPSRAPAAKPSRITASTPITILAPTARTTSSPTPAAAVTPVVEITASGSSSGWDAVASLGTALAGAGSLVAAIAAVIALRHGPGRAPPHPRSGADNPWET